MTDGAGASRSARLPLYLLLNVGFLGFVGVAASIAAGGTWRALYLVLLFAICSSPVLVIRKPNDRYALFAAFCGIYFVSFGVVDLIALALGRSAPGRADAMSAAEVLIVLGGVAFVSGYLLAARRRVPSTAVAADWPFTSLVIVGLVLWSAGTAASWYWSIVLTVRSGEFHNDSGLAVTTGLMIGQYAQPLGLLIVAYAYTMSRSLLLSLVMTALAVFQVFLGFVSDTKGGAMLGGLMVIVTAVLVRGKIPKLWVLAGILFVVFAFPVFQAHRMYVVGDRGQSNAAAVANLGKDLDISIGSEQRAAAEHAQSFFERSSVKGSVEMIVGKTGNGVAYQHGYTLIPLLTAFIPRIIWPDKLDVQTGELVNTEFHVTGDNVTYISPSYIGELYWNFGWPGALLGMVLLGAIMGWINGLCDLSRQVSVTRVLILGITILQLGVRFESSIAAIYSVWLRSIVGILILHWLFARRGPAPSASSWSLLPAAQPEPTFVGVRFPNLLR
jgi:hypothetical protein